MWEVKGECMGINGGCGVGRGWVCGWVKDGWEMDKGWVVGG